MINFISIIVLVYIKLMCPLNATCIWKSHALKGGFQYKTLGNGMQGNVVKTQWFFSNQLLQLHCKKETVVLTIFNVTSVA